MATLTSTSREREIMRQQSAYNHASIVCESAGESPEAQLQKCREELSRHAQEVVFGRVEVIRRSKQMCQMAESDISRGIDLNHMQTTVAQAIGRVVVAENWVKAYQRLEAELSICVAR